MRILSVSKYKGSTYETELDDGRKIYLHADIIADFAVHSDMELDQTELRKIIYASNFRRGYQYALHLLDYRDYSYKEMLEKLVKTYKNENLCIKIMKRLTEHGFIDDERYAERLARKYIESKRYGERRVRSEMMRKGLDKFVITDAIAQYDELFEENLDWLLENKHSRNLQDKNDRKSVEKVKCALVRYGYSFGEINEAVFRYFEELEAQEE